jgi:hypothetical protein
MWRIAVIAVAAALTGLACGGSEDETGSGTPESAACPQGTQQLRARDVIGEPPAGFQIAAGDPKALKTFVDQVRPQVGHRWVNYDAKVLVRRGKLNGAAVIVINTNEKTGSSENFLESAKRAEERTGTPGEDITIGERPGRLRQAADGGSVATALAGPCSVVMMVADTEPLLRDAAAVIRGA